MKGSKAFGYLFVLMMLHVISFAQPARVILQFSSKPIAFDNNEQVVAVARISSQSKEVLSLKAKPMVTDAANFGDVTFKLEELMPDSSFREIVLMMTPMNIYPDQRELSLKGGKSICWKYDLRNLFQFKPDRQYRLMVTFTIYKGDQIFKVDSDQILFSTGKGLKYRFKGSANPSGYFEKCE